MQSPSAAFPFPPYYTSRMFETTVVAEKVQVALLRLEVAIPVKATGKHDSLERLREGSKMRQVRVRAKATNR